MLICTDAVARGIDIEDVSCVVSYEAPQSVKTYVHRIGRTARAGKTGQAYTLLLHNQVRAIMLLRSFICQFNYEPLLDISQSPSLICVQFYNYVNIKDILTDLIS